MSNKKQPSPEPRQHLPLIITTREVAIAALIPHPRNYTVHPESQIAQLVASYRRFGQFRSIVAVERAEETEPATYLIVAGHGMVEAMSRAGATTVRIDALPKDTPASTVEAILIADNLHSTNSTTNDDLLALLLQEQADAGYDLSALGTDEETLRQMLESLGDGYLAQDDSSKLDIQFKEFDESIADDLDTELCQQCGKLCIKSGKDTH